VLIPNAS